MERGVVTFRIGSSEKQHERIQQNWQPCAGDKNNIKSLIIAFSTHDKYDHIIY
jgi:hypothetical protein